MNNLLALIIAYLLGSLTCAVLLTKLLKLPDPRTTGSKNPGATNILRTVGKNQALAVLVGDALKGFIAILLARILGVHGFMLGLVALSAVLGHIYPIFHKFEGGKGVATMLGTLLMLNFWVGLFAVAVWVVIAFLLPLCVVILIGRRRVCPSLYFDFWRSPICLSRITHVRIGRLASLGKY